MSRFEKKGKVKRPTLRRSQTVTTFGVGAIADLPDASVMICGTDKWDTRGSVSLSDPRLEKKLGVSYFLMAPDSDAPGDGITAVRFPRWMRCRKCRTLRGLETWREAAQSTKRFPYFDNKPYCDVCSLDLIPSRFVVACNKGHIDDFPFIEWAHFNKEVCSSPALQYQEIGSSASLSGIRIFCKNCECARSMGGSFSKDILEKVSQCKGAMPWENILNSECGARLTTLQRGGTNVHYPSLKSSILIPPHSSQNLKTKIAETLSWQFFDSQQDGVDVSVIIPPIAKELEQTEAKILETINEMIEGSKEESSGDSKTEEEYRYEEYLAFLGEYDKEQSDAHDFLTEQRTSKEYGIPLLESVVLVKKLRELRVQTGFTRIKPPQVSQENDDENDEKIEIMPVSQRRQKWLPGYEVRGEGIFLEFNKDELKKWANNADVKAHLAPLIARSTKNPDAFGIVPELSPEFVFLHSLSHVLIKQLSFECGYSSSALRERLYCSNALGKTMYGILIYTAEGDADGTLGGLVRQGEADLFKNTMLSALNESQWCSSDPLCIESTGQGYQALNLAACHSCCMLPETSCELINRYLDRATLVGTLTNPEIGLYTDTIKQRLEQLAE
jgi:hypothetical protein